MKLKDLDGGGGVTVLSISRYCRCFHLEPLGKTCQGNRCPRRDSNPALPKMLPLESPCLVSQSERLGLKIRKGDQLPSRGFVVFLSPFHIDAGMAFWGQDWLLLYIVRLQKIPKLLLDTA
jgi:hypothetical protein